MLEPTALIFETSQASFASNVLERSREMPVLVEFMSAWSEHLRAHVGRTRRSGQ